jgi:6,7-dimethyl-8-ribityllumazine synthase
MSSSLSNFDTSITEMAALDAHIVVVYTQWNKVHIDAMLQGANVIFSKYAPNAKISLIEVPGCIEIPFTIHSHYLKNSLTQNKADAYIAFGIVIKGDTSHFKYVCNSVTNGITHLNVNQTVPTIYGVLTVHNELQILERLGGKHGHKGEEAAITALRMININNKL